MTRFRRILCASDFSKTSGRALALAIDVAKANHARLMILYAYVPIVPLVPEQYIDSSTWTRLDTETRRWVERQLAKLAARARKAGVRASAMIVTGDPAQRIVGLPAPNVLISSSSGRTAGEAFRSSSSGA